MHSTKLQPPAPGTNSIRTDALFRMCAVIRPLIRWGMQSYILPPKTYESNISELASDHFIDFKRGKLGRIATEMGLGCSFASQAKFSYTTYISMPFSSRYFQLLRNLDYVAYVMLPNIVKLAQTWKYNKENVTWSRCIRLLGKGLLIHTGFAIGASSALLSEKFNYLFMIFALPILDWFADYVISDASIDNKNIKTSQSNLLFTLPLSEYLDQSDFTRIINWDAPNIYTTMAKVNDIKTTLRQTKLMSLNTPLRQAKKSSVERVNVQKKKEEAKKTGKVVRCRLFQRRAFDPDDEGDKHFRRCEDQFMRSAQRVDKMPNGMRGLKEVVYVINPALSRKFQMKKNEMERRLGSDEGENEMILAWHGTASTNIDSIVQNNFDLAKISKNTGVAGLYGAGIYFSEYANISQQYGNGLLLCKVMLGKVYKMRKTNVGCPKERGYDSHMHSDKGIYGDEIVIFDIDQILPCYIVKY